MNINENFNSYNLDENTKLDLIKKTLMNTNPYNYNDICANLNIFFSVTKKERDNLSLPYLERLNKIYINYQNYRQKLRSRNIYSYNSINNRGMPEVNRCIFECQYNSIVNDLDIIKSNLEQSTMEDSQRQLSYLQSIDDKSYSSLMSDINLLNNYCLSQRQCDYKSNNKVKYMKKNSNTINIKNMPYNSLDEIKYICNLKKEFE